MDANAIPAAANSANLPSAASAPTTAPTYRLYDPTSVLIASFLGSPIAGVLLISLNYRRLNRRAEAIAAFIVGVIATVLASLLSYFLPSSGGIAIGIVIAMATRSAAERFQGEALSQHISAGGQLGSRWAATGIGLAFLAALSAIIVAGALTRGADHKVLVGTKDEVYYVGAATRQDAQALGEALKIAGYFQDRGVSVILTKDQDGTSVSLVVKDGLWESPEAVTGAEVIGRQIAPSIGGLPIKVRLVNNLRETKKEIPLAP